MPRQVMKTLYAKRVKFKPGRTKGFVGAPIDELLLEILNKAPTWSKRHWPPPPAAPNVIGPGVACSFISRIAPRTHGDQKGVYFEVGTYTNGHAPDQMALDFLAAEPDITTARVRDDTGQTREIVIRCRCVALGETVIIENVRGSGGVHAVQRLLSKLLQSYCLYGPQQRRYPTVEFIDVMSGDLRQAILQGDGVEKVTLRLVDGAQPDEDAWLHPLRQGKDRFGNAAVFTGTWEAAGDDVLNTDDVITAAEERDVDDTDLDAIVIHLKDGNRITALGSYKARHEVYVTVDDAGVTHYSELIEGLWSYLDSLRRPKNNWRLLNDDGKFTTDEEVQLVPQP